MTVLVTLEVENINGLKGMFAVKQIKRGFGDN